MFNVNKSLKRILKDNSKSKKCVHCGDELGEGDNYNLYKRHMGRCHSKVAQRLRKSIDEEEYQEGY